MAGLLKWEKWFAQKLCWYLALIVLAQLHEILSTEETLIQLWIWEHMEGRINNILIFYCLEISYIKFLIPSTFGSPCSAPSSLYSIVSSLPFQTSPNNTAHSHVCTGQHPLDHGHCTMGDNTKENRLCPFPYSPPSAYQLSLSWVRGGALWAPFLSMIEF